MRSLGVRHRDPLTVRSAPFLRSAPGCLTKSLLAVSLLMCAGATRTPGYRAACGLFVGLSARAINNVEVFDAVLKYYFLHFVLIHSLYR